jgi:hypothetical protein
MVTLCSKHTRALTFQSVLVMNGYWVRGSCRQCIGHESVLAPASGAALAEKNQLAERVAVTVRWQMAFFYLGAAFWKVNPATCLWLLAIRYATFVTCHSFVVILVCHLLYRICYSHVFTY